MFSIFIRFQTIWDISDYSIFSPNWFRGLDLHFRSINYFFDEWCWTTKPRRYLFLVSLSFQQINIFQFGNTSQHKLLHQIHKHFFDITFDQYNKFCTFTFITNLHIKNTCLCYLTVSLSSWNEWYQRTQKILQITFQTHERSLREPCQMRVTRCLKKEYHEYAVLVTMNSKSSSSPSTLYA